MTNCISSGEQLATPSEFQFTLCLWHNHRDIIGRDASGDPICGDWKKVLSHTGSFDQFEYGQHYFEPAAGIQFVKDRHQFCEEDPDRPGRIRQQVGIVCTRKSGTIADDIDHLDEWEKNGIPLGAQDAYTKSGRGYHVLIDARQFRDRWPTQGSVLGGDVKSNGFVAAPASIHYTGRKYEATGLLLVAATADLMEAHRRETRARYVSEGNGGGHSGGDGQDDLLFGYTKELYRKGLSRDEAYALWRIRADALPLKNPDYPWGEVDFDRHWHSCEKSVQRTDPALAAWARQVNTNSTLDIGVNSQEEWDGEFPGDDPYDEDGLDEGMPPSWHQLGVLTARPRKAVEYTAPGCEDLLALMDAQAAREVAEHNRDALPDISALTGIKRDKAFTEVTRLESDDHWYFARNWRDEEDLRDKYLNVLLPSMWVDTVKRDDEIFRRFTAEEIDRLMNHHRRIAWVGDELHALGFAANKSDKWKSDDSGTAYIPTGLSTRAVGLLLVAAANRGEGVSSNAGAGIINHNKKSFGLTPGVHRDITPENFRQIKRRMRQAGLIGTEISGRAYVDGKRNRAYCPEVVTISAELRGLVYGFIAAQVNTNSTLDIGVNSPADVIAELGARWLEEVVKPYHRRYWAKERSYRNFAASLSSPGWKVL